MSIALAWLARGGWQYIAAAALIIAAYFWAYNRGADHTQAKWDAAKARGVLVAVQMAQERQAEKDRADNLGAQNNRLVTALADAKRPEVRNYYEQNPSRNVACLGADRLRDIAKSDAAAYAAAHATK